MSRRSRVLWPLALLILGAAGLVSYAAYSAAKDRTNLALVRAAGGGNAPEVRLLLATGADPNASFPVRVEDGPPGIWERLRRLVGVRKDDLGPVPMQTALTACFAVRNVPGTSLQEGAPESLEIVEALLRAGAKPDVIDINGETPLICAAQSGFADTVRLLLRYGADPNIMSTSSPGTALASVAYFGDAAMVKLLLANGARKAVAEGTDGESLYYAAEMGHTHIVKLLLEAGARVDTRDDIGYTPLMRAVESERVEVVRVLLRAGAGPNIRSDDGSTAAKLARSSASRAIRRLFERH